MAAAVREIKSGCGNPLERVRVVTLEQIAAAIARLEVKMDHATEAIHKIEAIVDRHDARISVTEKITEKARHVWWTITKAVTVIAGAGGGIVFLIEHVGKFMVVAK